MPGTINKYVDKLARANTLEFQEKKKIQLHKYAIKHLILAQRPNTNKPQVVSYFVSTKACDSSRYCHKNLVVSQKENKNKKQNQQP